MPPMTKQEITQIIEETSFTEDLKELLRTRIELYPEQVEEKHLNDFEQYVRELEARETEGIAALEQAAEELATAADEAEEEFDAQLAIKTKQIERASDKLQDLQQLPA